MQCSEYEIVSAYKNAKLKGKQLSILADMNCCTREQMRQYLLEHGIPEEELPKKPGRKIKKTKETTNCERKVCHGVPVAEPAVEPVVEPVAEPVDKPVVEPVVEPVDKPVSEPTGSHNELPELVKTALKNEEQRISRDISQTAANLSQKKSLLKLRQDEYERISQEMEEIGKTIDRLTEEHKEKTEALKDIQSLSGVWRTGDSLLMRIIS